MFYSRFNLFFLYVCNGIFFTIFGPTLFWLAYPLGPVLSVLSSDFVVHTLRFYSFKLFVFRNSRKYNVNARSYFLSILPNLVFRLILMRLLYDFYDRTILTMVMAFVSIVVGFISSEYIFKKSI